MSKTVVGLFSNMAKAEQVKASLLTEGYDSSEVKVMANGDTGTTGEGIGEKVSSFFKNLTGGDDETHHHYATGVNQGGALVAVTVDDEEASDAAALLKEHGARTIEGEAQSAAAMPVRTQTPTQTSNLTGETAIPIVEEQLVVGKREVDRGGVRVYSHVVERPVDADVMLREEHVDVQRRAVNRPATAADFAAGSGAVMELTAMGEEAVVGKTSRVVQEVVIGKESSQHTEAIHDTVRKTEVEVEQLVPGSTSTTTKKDLL